MSGEIRLDPTWLCAVAGALGLVVGSFLNVVIHRLPLDESIVRPGSHCPACQAPVRPWDNVPVLSYLWLRARCRGCGAHISLRYPAVELLTGLVFAGIAWRYGPTPAVPVLMLLSGGLIAAGAIDFDHQIIPDEISVGGLLLGLLGLPLLHAALGEAALEALRHSALGAALGGGMLWTVAFVHARLSVALGREFPHWPGEGEAPPKPSSADYWMWFPGMGFGDIKLLAMIGAFLGPAGVLLTIIAASLLGLVLGGVWALFRRSLGQPFGFGPAIAMGALVAILVPPGWLAIGA